MSDNNYVYLVLRKADSKSLGADVAPAGSPLYVGISSNERRFRDLKRGKLTFEDCQIHKLAVDLSREEACQMEMDLIAQYGRKDLCTGILVNQTDGGDGGGLGVVVSEKTRLKMSEARRGRAPSAQTRAKIAEANRGKSHSAEHRAKISEALRGKKHSEQTRAKISAAQKGKPKNYTVTVIHSEATKKKLAEANSSLWCVETPEGRKLFVKNLDSFCRDHGLHSSAMYVVAQGKRKHHKGYRCWKSEED